MALKPALIAELPGNNDVSGLEQGVIGATLLNCTDIECRGRPFTVGLTQNEHRRVRICFETAG